jgi:hypothetical protein
MRASISARRFFRAARSKKPPELREARLEIGNFGEGSGGHVREDTRRWKVEGRRKKGWRRRPGDKFGDQGKAARRATATFGAFW